MYLHNSVSASAVFYAFSIKNFMKKVILRHIFINGYASVFVSLGLETLAIGLCVEHGDDEEAIARTVGVIAGMGTGAVSKYADEMIGGSYVTDKYRERVLSAVGQAH